MLSNYRRYFKLAAYLSTFTQEAIVIAMGVPTLRELFKEKHYADLDGAFLFFFSLFFDCFFSLSFLYLFLSFSFCPSHSLFLILSPLSLILQTNTHANKKPQAASSRASAGSSSST